MLGNPLLKPIKLGRLELPNRVVMAPLTRQRASQPGNVPGPLTVEYYGQRAGAGLIISEGSQICPEGQGYAWTPGIHSDEQVEGWKLVTDRVHQKGGLMFMQLWHVGRISHQLLQPDNAPPVGPSAIRANADCFVVTADGDAFKTQVEMPRALETSELADIVKSYCVGALNAMRAGFDGVEVHAANGYLLDQFLCSNSNKRNDEYGGSVECRARLVLEVVDNIIETIGDAGRVGIRISPMGTFNDVNDADPLQTFTYLLEQLNTRHLAYVHVNKPDWAGGTYDDFDEFFLALRRVYHGTVIHCGGHTGKSGIQMLEAGEADLIGFGRSYIANPDLVERIKQGAEWNELDVSTLYGGGAQGYTDYPFLS